MIKSAQLGPLLSFIARVTENPVLVLRGYEQMPEKYSNDVDIFLPEDLLEVLVAKLKVSDVFRVENVDQRLGLLKLQILTYGEVIDLDILYGFYYFGLEYYDKKQLWSQKLQHASGVFVIPQPEAELTISLYKEILHNGRIRSDKISGFQNVNNVIYPRMISKYIGVKDCSTVENFVRNGVLDVSSYRRKFLLNLLIKNIFVSKFNVLTRIAHFMWIKYVKKEEKFIVK